MTTHDATRRTFLVRAAVGAGAVAGAGLTAGANAENPAQHEAADTRSQTQPRTGDGQHGAFFNHDHAATVAAFTERLMPGAPGKPGARDAAVLNYIDLALAGAYAELQDFYRRGLAQLDAYCRQVYKESFVRLDAARQDRVIASLEEGTATGFTWPAAQEFFNTVRTHTMEGLFADPVYGGNKDFAGWRLVGFPGAQPVFTPADMQSRQAFARAPMIGLQLQARGRS
ncbi:MAG: gluconate 2-dehydrogenase subunit 3 family protein [Vicinamibacterales bacterium]